MTDRVLVWFRGDLRTVDHGPLRTAAAAHQMAAVFCFDPRQFKQTSFGFQRCGIHRTRFLLESVADLRRELRRLGGELIVRVAHPEAVLSDLVQSLRIDTLVYHREVGTEEANVQCRVEQACRKQGVTPRVFDGQTMLAPDALPFAIDQTPEVFTQFRNRVERTVAIDDPIDAPESLTPIPLRDGVAGELPTSDELIGERWPDSPATFGGGQTAGLDRLNAYVWQSDRLRVYKKTRNGMLHRDDSSKFSPWLSAGCLSPRTIFAQVRRYERARVKNDSTYWLIFELLWRDYFHLIAAKHGRKIFRASGLRGVDLPWELDWVRFGAWREGRTGYPIVDANLRELAATGFMSNRGRQIVASFLTKNLNVDWRLGAQWFESQLVDYAVASNYGNWNYAAGVGNDARGFRFFNVTKQSRDYDPNGDYARHWLPELRALPREVIHEPWRMTADVESTTNVKIGKDYPPPIVDLHESAKNNQRAYENAFKLKLRSD